MPPTNLPSGRGVGAGSGAGAHGRGPGGGDRREVEVGEVALGVEGRGTTGAGSGDRLTVVVVDEVATGEDTRHVGAGGRGVHEHVALVVQPYLSVQELRTRVVTDGDEQA